MIEVKCISVGSLGTNCYVVRDKFSGKAAVVDPGGVNARLFTALDEMGRENIEYILLTHGHFDHIEGVNILCEKYNPQVVICEDEEVFLSDENLNLSRMISGSPFEPIYADIKLKSGDVLALGETEFKFIKTPGHTSGSGCYVFEKDRIIFTGDTLFRESMGRTDFPTGDLREMHKSLMLLKSFNGDYKVYPGHNADTTLEHERKNNIYMS